ncbi:MAG: hypothetical protein NTX50_17700, partial [Candidatus Sumerlaeota bacterium]|nr:hypothetical protein [Candidatus Sumerlaeota bacterium]
AAPAFGVRWLAAFLFAPRPLKRQKEGGKREFAAERESPLLYSKSWRCYRLHYIHPLGKKNTSLNL